VVLIFKIVASVLKLGNIGFTPTSNIDGTEGCTVSNDYGMFFLSRPTNRDGKFNRFCALR
jgi:hypothetical protein